MNIPLLIANFVLLLAVIVHVFWGDKDLKAIDPDDNNHEKTEKWVMARGAFHIVSVDFLMAAIGLTLINFTSVFDKSKILLLTIMSIYFLMYAIAFFVSIVISKQFPKNHLKLGQWILLLLTSGLIYLGTF